MTYIYGSRAQVATFFRRSLSPSRLVRFAGSFLAALLLLVGGMGAHDAQGQNTGVPAQPLGDSFVFFVDRIAPTGTGETLLKVGDGSNGVGVSYQVVDDPTGGDNQVLQLINHTEYAYPRFYFADNHDQGVPRDLTANRNAGNVLHFRIMVDENNPKDGGGNIVEQYRLAIQFEDYGPDNNTNDNMNTAFNYPFRLRWAIPDSMRGTGKWHNVSLTLPPATWDALEMARTADPSSLSDLEKNWKYTGAWAGDNPGRIGLDLLGPATAENPTLWKEFEWDKVESFGIQWDWGGSNNPRAPIYLDDIYIGPADLDLTGMLPPVTTPPAVSSVNFRVDGSWHVVSVSHDATATDISQYKVYASHSPITDLKAQSVTLAGTITDPSANNGNPEIRFPGELPHPSVGNAIYYAVTSIEGNTGLENQDISGSSGSLKASHSPAIVQLTDQEAATLKANIAAGNVSRSGFPGATMPFTVNKAHSVNTVGASPEDNDLSAAVYIGYSDANEIYIYAEVTDDNVEISPTERTPAETWQDDTIEFVWGNYDVRDAGGSIVGGSPHDDGERGVNGTNSSELKKRGNYPDYHIRISAHGTEAEATVRNESSLPGGTTGVDKGSGAYAPMTGGYKILQVLPVADFKDPKDSAPAFPGATAIRYSPLSITLNDRDEGSRGDQITWSLRAVEGGDNVYRKPWQWQTVAMVGRHVPDTPQVTVTDNPGDTKLLRVGGGDLAINLDGAITEFGNADWTVHHYLVDGAEAVNDPGASFIAGSHARVQLDDRDILTITPISAGAFKIAFQPADAEGDAKVRPIQFEIVAADAPMVTATGVRGGTQYNASANGYAETVNLKLREKTSQELELYDRFSDPNQFTLDFGIYVANPNVATAVRNEDKLRISLAETAKGGDATDVWVIATDTDGGYARLRIGVNVASATSPYVANPLPDLVLREMAEEDAIVNLFGVFADGNGDELEYEIKLSDEAAVKLGSEAPFVHVTSYMRTEENLTDTGPNPDKPNLRIKPLRPGSVTFTVKATDKPTGVEKQSVEDSFSLTVVSKTSPVVKTQIPDTTIAAEDEPLRISMADVDTDKDGDQPAFETPGDGVLRYSASSQDQSVVRAGVRGGVLSLTPVWTAEGGETNVTVSATNDAGETWPQTFKVTVTGASLPIVNPKVQPILDAGIMLTYGALWVQDLTDIKNPLNPEESLGALFIDPNADPNDVLPGGFHLQMGVEDVTADHRYDELSVLNDVYTSAMRITLDPATGVLTIAPTAANDATITIHGMDRELNPIEATMTVSSISKVTSAEGTELPTEVSLSQNYPNPFNPQTTIEYALPEAGDVSLIVYDMLGREVRTLLDGPQTAGLHTVRFDANALPNGTYVYRLVTPSKSIARTMVLVK